MTFRCDLGATGDGTPRAVGERGRFFDICTGSMYDLSGRALEGAGSDLR